MRTHDRVVVDTFQKAWHKEIPLKVSFFVWSLIQDIFEQKKILQEGRSLDQMYAIAIVLGLWPSWVRGTLVFLMIGFFEDMA